MKALKNASKSALMAALVVAATASGAWAQWPERDITFIVPYNPGGSTDPVGRIYASELSRLLETGVTVENRPGASATIGTAAVVNASPDGYTIGLGSNSSLSHQPLERSNLEWSSPEDYDTIVKLAELPAVLYVRADSKYENFDQFLEDVRARPGEVRVSTSGLRTAPDLVVQYFNALADVKIATVPFTGGGGEALTAVLSGRVEGSVGYGPSINSYVEAGQIRPIAVFSEGVYAPFPEATPISETGFEAYIPANYYVIAPNGLPEDVRAKLVEVSTQIIQGEAFREFADANLYVVPDPSGEAAEEELTNFQKIFADTLAYIEKEGE